MSLYQAVREYRKQYVFRDTAILQKSEGVPQLRIEDMWDHQGVQEKVALEWLLIDKAWGSNTPIHDEFLECLAEVNLRLFYGPSIPSDRALIDAEKEALRIKLEVYQALAAYEGAAQSYAEGVRKAFGSREQYAGKLNEILNAAARRRALAERVGIQVSNEKAFEQWKELLVSEIDEFFAD